VKIAQVPIASTRNAALQGTADVLNAYAKQIQESDCAGWLLRPRAAGNNSISMSTETIDQAKARGETSPMPRFGGNMKGN